MECCLALQGYWRSNVYGQGNLIIQTKTRMTTSIKVKIVLHSSDASLITLYSVVSVSMIPKIREIE